MICKTEQPKFGSATRISNRRANTIGEGEIDAARRHILRPRRSLTYPHVSSFPCSQIKSDAMSRRCNRCNLNNSYISFLSTKIKRVEELVENLGNITTSANYNNKNSSFTPSSVIFGSEVVDFSKMNVNELISFSSKLGAGLFGNHVVTSESENTSKVKNRMNINAIINSGDN